MAATPSQRNWKGIAIALLVIGAVIGLVALAVVIITPADGGPRVKGDRLTLRDVVDPDRFSPRGLNGSWISGETERNLGDVELNCLWRSVSQIDQTPSTCSPTPMAGSPYGTSGPGRRGCSCQTQPS